MSAAAVIEAARELRERLRPLHFGDPVSHVYQPLDYAWSAHELYLRRFAESSKRVVFLGMNPGPWGMAQTGVPFGEVPSVRDWMGIESAIGHPDRPHPKRPIEGFACERSEVSGRRLWGLFAERFGSAEAFFAEHFVANYCPLVFMEESGRNRTPDKLAGPEREQLRELCDRHLHAVLNALRPEWVVGVGGYARECLERVVAQMSVPPRVATVLHPSPASPAANRGWAQAATRQLIEQGVWS